MAPRTVIASGDALDPRLQPYASPKFDLEDFEDEHLNSLTEKARTLQLYGVSSSSTRFADTPPRSSPPGSSCPGKRAGAAA